MNESIKGLQLVVGKFENGIRQRIGRVYGKFGIC